MKIIKPSILKNTKKTTNHFINKFLHLNLKSEYSNNPNLFTVSKT